EIATRFATLGDASVTNPQVSEVLIEVAGVLGDFLARLFDIRSDVEALADETLNYEKIFQFKQDFLRTRVFKEFGKSLVDDAMFQLLDAEVQRLVQAAPQQADPEIRFADTVLTLQQCEKSLTAGVDPAE